MCSAATIGVLAATAFVGIPVAQADHGQQSQLPLGSMYHVVDQIGARDLWEDGITGEGVNVAVIDTGITPVAALSEPDKIVAVVDLSAEAQVSEAKYLDTYGHGTHIAGIIAGRTPGADPALAEEHPEWFMGVAPDAGLVSVKVGDNTGAVDVTQMIAAVDWVTEHADELDIRVLNLSYSSGSLLPYRAILAAAVERAWRRHRRVVAAGNGGNDANRLAARSRPLCDRRRWRGSRRCQRFRGAVVDLGQRHQPHPRRCRTGRAHRQPARAAEPGRHGAP
jgi:subtilisin family serine protease